MGREVEFLSRQRNETVTARTLFINEKMAGMSQVVTIRKGDLDNAGSESEEEVTADANAEEEVVSEQARDYHEEIHIDQNEKHLTDTVTEPRNPYLPNKHPSCFSTAS